MNLFVGGTSRDFAFSAFPNDSKFRNWNNL